MAVFFLSLNVLTTIEVAANISNHIPSYMIPGFFLLTEMSWTNIVLWA